MRLNSDLISERRAHSFDPLAGRAGDGLCTLEVFQTYDEILRENMMLLQRMAKRMLSCITDAGHRGGIMTGVVPQFDPFLFVLVKRVDEQNFSPRRLLTAKLSSHPGLSRNINFILSSYSPQITCLAPLPASPSVAPAFAGIFATMPASKDRKPFGTRLTPAPRVVLPRGYQAPPRPGVPWTEAIAVTIEGTTTEEASWWEIYKAASAVWAVCGSEGSGRGAGSEGIAEGVGDHGRISVILKLINVRDHGNATAAVEVS
ncbi:MAG: hypothetical protein LQ350_007061 [Teloschistes chrysophthalmus]|nr:MAG: hypothetical protein LQ350_007061 [Niorma chrysophthalma]